MPKTVTDKDIAGVRQARVPCVSDDIIEGHNHIEIIVKI